jgi:predicted ester cyclase
MKVEEMHIDGDRVAQIGTLTGTDTGGFMGIPPTGKSFKLPIVVLYTVADGCIVRERRIYDFTGMLVQAGILKAKPA